MNANTEAALSCRTLYPIVLLHGIGYRDDMLMLNSWGRIPNTLEAAGARVFQGGMDAWNSHENSALVLKPNVEQVLSQTGSAKVNIIAHSKGGLEARYLISKLDMADKVASLTTVCTPHHGSAVADLVAGDIPDTQNLLSVNFFKRLAQRLGFGAMDILARITGDKSPQAGMAIKQLTRSYLAEFNRQILDVPGVYYQSYGTLMRLAIDDPVFAATHVLLKRIEGDNDGMVSTLSCQWGRFRGLIGDGNPDHGLSHGDLVDYRGMLLTHFNVPAVYLDIVKDLKQQGF
ncbi:esterase/lipase family protein [Methylomonas sp. 11b]|uniref:esterase/lipase family protein n=1 Tax=Methylomonas sp. 11b TaxID=1168169 RepID=UPI00047C32B1|nr:alpha/beta fold hydrolase [Methylomonas sp. 11b]